MKRNSPYPGRVAIRHVVEAARAVGIDVVGFEVSVDGTIRVLDARSVPNQAETAYDRWKRQQQRAA